MKTKKKENGEVCVSDSSGLFLLIPRCSRGAFHISKKWFSRLDLLRCSIFAYSSMFSWCFCTVLFHRLRGIGGWSRMTPFALACLQSLSSSLWYVRSRLRKWRRLSCQLWSSALCFRSYYRRFGSYFSLSLISCQGGRRSVPALGNLTEMPFGPPSRLPNPFFLK